MKVTMDFLKEHKRVTLLIALFLAVLVWNMVTYTVAEDQVAVVKTLGKITTVIINPTDADMVKRDLETKDLAHVKVVTEKGLHFRVPLIQWVSRYDARYEPYVSMVETINTFDRRKIDIMIYSLNRIVNPARYSTTLGSTSEMNKLLDDKVYPVVVQSANTLSFNDFFNMEKVIDSIAKKKDTLNEAIRPQNGIYVVDIGIHRKNFPKSNITDIQNKMIQEIQKDSEKLVAEGQSQYDKTKAEIDRQKSEMLADARIEAAKIKAGADKEALQIYQNSLQKDLEFYQFIKRMEMYKNLKGKTIFADKNNKFLTDINGY